MIRYVYIYQLLCYLLFTHIFLTMGIAVRRMNYYTDSLSSKLMFRNLTNHIYFNIMMINIYVYSNQTSLEEIDKQPTYVYN